VEEEKITEKKRHDFHPSIKMVSVSKSTEVKISNNETDQNIRR